MSTMGSDDDMDIYEFAASDDDDGEENYAPVAGPASKTVKRGGSTKASKTTKKKNSKVDDDSVSVLSMNSNVGNVVPVTSTDAGKKKTVEELYQKKTPLEHILLRPDTYIGSVERHTDTMFILENERIVEREITYTPGLFKIFDEIVVNAADNKQRDPNMDKLEIMIDPENNLISVKNNGKGIPVVVHKEHNVYVPTLIFGHLLTGSNFNDDEKKTTGGRNGYGAKLANVFSNKFVVECVDVEEELHFSQTFRNNMQTQDKPLVRKLTAAQKKQGDFVKISFSPDLKRFKMSELDKDIVSLFGRRAYDIAGTMAQSQGKKLSVSLNGQKLPIKSFKDYICLFDGINPPVAYEKTGRWEVGISASTDATMKQVSFVNSIATSKGGTHVNYIAEQVSFRLIKALNKKKSKTQAEFKPSQVKNHLTIFVNCLIENPTFDSQTKENMTLKKNQFGSECNLSDKFIKQIEKSDVVESVLAYASFKDRQAMKRKGGSKKVKLTGIVKLDDANYAGTAKSRDCTLIITEGDSAKSLAVSGLSVVGRDYYGVFPLRGKPMNVRDATIRSVLDNEEIKNLVDIMGLKFQTVYDESNIKTLRYGHLMIMADQDTDGSHIKGLVINFLHHFWPSLLDVPGFLQQFITPIVKVSKGKQSRTFFTLPEYEQWLESTGNKGKGYTIKYYKGLGTSTSAEAKEYFSNLDIHEIRFDNLSSDRVALTKDEELEAALPDSVTSGSDLIDMVFRKTRVEDRKQWLNNLSQGTFLNYAEIPKQGVKYSDFINKEYILFSKYDNERSIPHVMDGFKPSQRKVLYACFKRKLKGEIKVAQLTGYVAEHSAYHHGEVSLQTTIVNMAQNFVGANNVNLLTPAGQFGTRRMGGKDAASARYIFTRLEPITRTIFHPDDDDLLTYNTDDGATIEPVFYLPVIPMVLVNGAEGIGTGWASTVCNYNPREIVDNIRRLIQGEQLTPMTPYYSGFTGEITLEDSKRDGSFVVKGRIERLDDTTLLISELPLKIWTQNYKQLLETMLNGDAKKAPEINDFKENHTENTVSFTVIADKEKIDEFEKEKGGLLGKFKLTGTLSVSNMCLFNKEAKIVKYETPEDIMREFYDLRLEYYFKRKDMLVDRLKYEQRKLSNKARFVEEVCSGELVVSNRKRKEILAELKERGYETFSNKESKRDSETEDSDNDESGGMEASDVLSNGYDYLLGMKIWSLTFEKAEELRRLLAEKTKELGILEGTAPEEIWLNDLRAVEAALDERDVLLAEAAEDERAAQKKNQNRQTTKKVTNKRIQKKKKKGCESDIVSSDDCMSVESEKKMARAAKITASRAIPVTKGPKKNVMNPPEQPVPMLAALPLSSSFESESGVGVTLLKAVEEKLHVSPPPKKSSSNNAKPDKKRPPTPPLPNSDSEFDALSVERPQPVAQKPTAKTNQATKKPKATAPRKPAASGRRPAAGAKPKSKKLTKTLESDSSQEDFDFKSDKSEEAAGASKDLAPTRTARNVRTMKTTKYVFSDSESDFE